MLKQTFGTPEYHVPSRYCKGFNYAPTDIKFPTEQISFRTNNRDAFCPSPWTMIPRSTDLAFS